MSKPKVELSHSFNTWRLTTNSLSDLIGDVALAYDSDGTGEHLVTFTAPSDLIVAVNDLNTRKVKRTGDTMTGSLHFEQPTLTADDPFIDGHVTWNNAAVAFSGIHIDVTNTASHADSLLIDCRLENVPKFGVDINGAIIQKLTGSYKARDIVSGSRHVREYQDLNDASTQGLDTGKFEWGFSWNANWNGASYVKDRNNAGDHAIMHRTNDSFKDQVWFSDGTAPSAISWAKRIEYDYAGNTAWVDLATTITKDFTVGANKLTVNATNGNTAVAGTLTVAGATTVNNTFAVPSNATSLNSLTVSSTAVFNGAMTSNAGLSLVGGTVTSSTPFLTATQTWNNAGVTFSGIEVNITDTASGPNSLLLNFKLAGVDKFGVTATGTVIQKLSGSNLARDVVSGSRHVREYQDLNDSNTQGLGAAYNEWGYTWNAKWDTNQYVKDRSNVGDHAIMMRTDNSFRQQWWFSDGSTGGSPIAWVKKIDFDLPLSTGWMDLSLDVLRDFAVNTNKFTVASASGNTAVAGTLNVTGTITGPGSGITAINGSNISSGTVADARIAASLTGKTYNGFTLTANATGYTVSAGSTPVATTFAGGAAYTISGTNGTTITLPASTGTLPLNNQTMYIGTTAVTINRASANLPLTGVSSIAMPGSVSGSVTIQPAATAGATTITFPATTGIVITSGDTGTVTNTMLTGSIVDTKLLTISTAGKVSNSATTATSANTVSAIVARDISGDFSAGTITAALVGNASTATTLATGRTIGMTGDVSWTSASFNGSGNVTGTSTIGANAVTLAKMATMATASFLGRNTAATGNVEVLSAATARTMLSINNVENTALSTWAGTTNITTLGTISSGIWNATAIADGKIASALTGKTYNALSLTANATGFALAGGTTSKTLTVLNTMSLSGSDGSTLNISTGGTLGTAAFTETTAYLSSSSASTQAGYFGDIYLWDDSTPSHYLQITNSANLTAARTLSINVNDASRAISLGGDLTLSGALTVSAGMTLTAGAAGQTFTLPSTSATIARTDAGQTFTGIQTFSNSVTLNSSTAYAGTGSILLKNASNVVSDLTATANANKVLGAKGDATGFELKTISGGTGITVSHNAGEIVLTASGTFGATQLTGDLTVGNPGKFTVAATTGNTWAAGTLNVDGVTTLAATSATAFTASTSVATPKVKIATHIEQFYATLTTTAATAGQIISSLPGATYRSATFEIQAVDAAGAKFHKVLVSAIHNGSQTDSVEYGAAVLGSSCGTFTVDYSAGNIRLLVTPSSANSTVFKVLVTAMLT